MTAQFAWYSDLHLNFMRSGTFERFIERANRDGKDGVWLTGDITTGRYLLKHLDMLAQRLTAPLYFVLGNHDYWHSSFQQTEDAVGDLSAKHDGLIWLSDQSTITIAPNTALVGTENWYDASHGRPKHLFWTWDWFHIQDLNFLNCAHRVKAFRAQAKACTEKMKASLLEAFQHHDTVYAMTHVPPWKEATSDVGTLMEKFWLPYNVSSVMGQMFQQVMQQFPLKKLVVLCGHTHVVKDVSIAHNIECRVGGANPFRTSNLITLT